MRTHLIARASVRPRRVSLAMAGLATASLLAAALGVIVPTAGADCAVQGLVPRMLTPSTASLPRDGGGIVVGMRGTAGAGSPMPASLAFTRGRRTQELVGQPLAPGLVRFAAVSRLIAGPFATTSLGAPMSLTISRAVLPGVPTRPSVREMRRVAATGMSASRTPRAEVRATLEFPVPAGIVAVLAYWGEQGGATSWQPAIQGQTEIVAWSEPGRCDAAPVGTIGPSGGAVGRIAYVDAFGQVSPPSPSVPVQ